MAETDRPRAPLITLRTWPLVALVLGLVMGYLAYWLSPALAPLVTALVVAGALFFGLRALWRVEELASFARSLARGEDVNAPTKLEGISAALATSIGRLAGRARSMETTISSTTVVLQDLAAAVEPTTRTVQGWVGDDRERAAVLSRALTSTRERLGALRQRLDKLAGGAEQHAAGVGSLSDQNQAVTENVQLLTAIVDETAASIEEMTYSIKEVARNIEELSLAAEQTATSMNQMDSSISEVESNVSITSQLADEVARDAAKGAESVHRTLEGIDKISTTVSTASGVISGLGARIQEIGNILSVIEDVAEQTNLLALNAAIIAAQAGEHGRGFAVVADEIKELADKTGASTKEIAALIRAIQDESQNAIDAIAKGEKNVLEGVKLSLEAEQALAKILDSSKKSTQRFKTIASATVEQARGSKIVADAVERIARSVQQVAAATAEQARGSEQLMQGTERIKDLTQQVEHGNRTEAEAIEAAVKFVRELEQVLQTLRDDEAGYGSALDQLRTQLEELVARAESPAAELDPLFDLSPRLRGEAERIIALTGHGLTTPPTAA